MQQCSNISCTYRKCNCLSFCITLFKHSEVLTDCFISLIPPACQDLPGVTAIIHKKGSVAAMKCNNNRKVNTDAVPESFSSPHPVLRKSLLAPPSDTSIWHGKAQGEVILLGLEHSSQWTQTCACSGVQGCIHLHRGWEQVPGCSWTPYRYGALETLDA